MTVNSSVHCNLYIDDTTLLLSDKSCVSLKNKCTKVFTDFSANSLLLNTNIAKKKQEISLKVF